MLSQFPYAHSAHWDPSSATPYASLSDHPLLLLPLPPLQQAPWTSSLLPASQSHDPETHSSQDQMTIIMARQIGHVPRPLCSMRRPTHPFSHVEGNRHDDSLEVLFGWTNTIDALELGMSPCGSQRGGMTMSTGSECPLLDVLTCPSFSA